MSKGIPLIAIVGRTNVGKSTLFNLIADRDLAIVADRPGVTRDRNYVLLNNYTQPFALVDTGGLLGEENQELANAVREQTEIAIYEADLIIALFDGKHGCHALDQDMVNMLRQSKKQVLWVVNKCEKQETELAASEFYSLGIDELLFISAAHNQGIKELFKKIWEKLYLDEPKKIKASEAEKVISIAILGKPNVGKSTLVNKLLGEERVITSPIAGTTRDNVSVTLTRDGQKYHLIDTAGLRKKGKIKEKTLEKLYSLRSIRAISLCDVALLLVDATDGMPGDQEAKIADLIDSRGKGLVIVVNKWDAVEKDHKTVKEYERQIREKLTFCKYAPILFVSALTGRRCPSIFSEIHKVFESGAERIQTSELNKMIERAVEKNPPSIYRGRPIKFYFATQTDINPPTFVLFFNYPLKVGTAYVRYLKNYIRAQHSFLGYDVKLIIRKKRSEKEVQ